MSQRVYGPVIGAGVQVTELEGDKPIEPGAVGLVGYVGAFERGPTRTLIGPITGKAALARKLGKEFAASLAPDAAKDYLDIANGAGGILAVRVTDGKERPAGPRFLFDNVTRAFNLFCRRTSRTAFGQIFAKNGGRWGGRARVFTEEFTSGGDLTANTLTTGLTKFSKDEWKGGYLELDGVPNKTYPITGNTAAGVVSVASDKTMAADLAGGAESTNYHYYLTLPSEVDRGISFEIRDGAELPDTEFGLFVYVDGGLDPVLKYEDLSIDPESNRYWVNVINNDPSNEEIFVVDSYTGSRTADARPATFYGASSSVTAEQLNVVVHQYAVVSPGGGNATLALGATTDTHLEQTLTCLFSSATSFTVTSDRFGLLDAGPFSLGVAVTEATHNNKWVPPFTLTAGASPMAAGNTITLVFKPLRVNGYVGAFLYPDKVNEKRARFRIIGNDHDSIFVAPGSDLTVITTMGDQFLIEGKTPLVGGRDGVADLTDAHFVEAYDTDQSPFNRVVGKNYGLIKLATPGNTATAVQKAGAGYAVAKNHQYRYEVPANITDEAACDAYVNETLGRTEYAVVSFPSFGQVAAGVDGKQKTVSLTGMIHGREARIAGDFAGYHKAQAGETAILPRILALPTGDKVLNEEILNGRGIGVIKQVKGNFVVWGDRTLWLDATWKFKHERELMSHYEHVLQESFGFIIFGLNDKRGRVSVKTSMLTFFGPEYTKGALDQDYKFEEACSIKIDAENNTAVTKAAGDMIVEVLLRLTGTVERLRIFIGKNGIFESVG